MITFEVGDKERHTVSFNFDTMWGKIDVLVDGKKEISSRKMVIGKAPFVFEVGDKEKHEVKLELNLPVGFAFRGGDFTAHVDGKLVRQEHIGASPLVFIAIPIGIITFIVLSALLRSF